MTGVNLSTNPAASVDASFWTGSYGAIPGTNGQTAGTTRVTGLTGLPRTTGLKATNGGGYFRSAPALTTATVQYTASIYGYQVIAFGLNTSYLVWYNSDGSDNSYENLGSFAAAGGSATTAYRKSVTSTAPSGTVAVGFIIDSAIDSVLTAMMVEPTASASTYADGDSSGWVWDGTTGKSSSQESSTTTGAVAGSLASPVTGSLAGTETFTGSLAGSLAAPVTGSLAGVETFPGALAGNLASPVTGSLAGTETITGALAGSLASPVTGSLYDVPAPVGRWHTGTPTRTARHKSGTPTRPGRYRTGTPS